MSSLTCGDKLSSSPTVPIGSSGRKESSDSSSAEGADTRCQFKQSDDTEYRRSELHILFSCALVPLFDDEELPLFGEL